MLCSGRRGRYLVGFAVAILSASLLLPAVLGALTSSNQSYSSSIVLAGGVGARSLFFDPGNKLLIFTSVSGNAVTLSELNSTGASPGPTTIATFSTSKCPPIFATCPPSVEYFSADTRGDLFYVVKFIGSTERVVEQGWNVTSFTAPFLLFAAKECPTLGPSSQCPNTIEGAAADPVGDVFFDQTFPTHNATGAVTGNGTTRVLELPAGTNSHVVLSSLSTGDRLGGQVVYIPGQIGNTKIPFVYFALYNFPSSGPWVSAIERLQISNKTLKTPWILSSTSNGILFGMSPLPVGNNGTSLGLSFVYRVSKGPFTLGGSPTNFPLASLALGTLGTPISSVSQCSFSSGGVPCAFASETLPNPRSFLISFPTDGNLQFVSSTNAYFFPILPYSIPGSSTATESIQMLTSTQKFTSVANEDSVGLSIATGIATDTSGNLFFISDTGSIMEIFAS